MTSRRLATFPDKTTGTIEDQAQDESLEKTQVKDTTGGESGTDKIRNTQNRGVGEFPWKMLAIMDCGDRYRVEGFALRVQGLGYRVQGTSHGV